MAINVAIVHDYLRDYGEEERVLEALHRLYPQAPIYTAFVDYQRLGTEADRFRGWDLRTTLAQRFPAIDRYYQRYQSLLPVCWEALDLSPYDLVISSSGNYLSKSVLTRPETLHVSYCHTPPRHLWEAPPPRAKFWFSRWWQVQGDLKLRQYDFYAAQRVDRYVTNSHAVARRIHKFYRRAADVIPPPVRVRAEGRAGKQYYLYVGPLTRRHRVEWAIQACQALDRPLWIVGEGPEAERLRSLAAGSQIRFLGKQSAEEMVEIYSGARAILFPCPDIDFATAPVEAMGQGIPVIASAQSGLTEVILEHRTGLFFQEPNPIRLQDTIAQFESLRFSSIACIERAREFDAPLFTSRLEWFIAQALDDHRLQGVTPKREEEEDTKR
ncbi:MAG: glycosyltransferase [Leptolyngbyaceae cyanobacterium bins.59]|nr:glycosyltransferase [Leptolyngbyaceae cyanobacterium bins.59]